MAHNHVSRCVMLMEYLWLKMSLTRSVSDLDPLHFLQRFLAAVFAPVKVFTAEAVDPSAGRCGGRGQGARGHGSLADTQ